MPISLYWLTAWDIFLGAIMTRQLTTQFDGAITSVAYVLFDDLPADSNPSAACPSTLINTVSGLLMGNRRYLNRWHPPTRASCAGATYFTNSKALKLSSDAR